MELYLSRHSTNLILIKGSPFVKVVPVPQVPGVPRKVPCTRPSPERDEREGGGKHWSHTARSASVNEKTTGNHWVHAEGQLLMRVLTGYCLQCGPTHQRCSASALPELGNLQDTLGLLWERICQRSPKQEKRSRRREAAFLGRSNIVPNQDSACGGSDCVCRCP
jgi:hypothetical protein